MSRHNISALSLTVGLLLSPVFPAPLFAQTREEKVRADKEKVEADGFWIYNDLPAAFAQAKESGKPMLVVLRCIPCEECVKLDDDLVDKDPVIRPLLEQFVCVRQVSTNGLDLNTFQYDTDQSFAIFMLSADGTVYGRFGTRSHRTQWFGDVSLKGLADALRGALALHQDYPSNRASLSGKTGKPLEFATPEKFPSLKDKFTASLNYEGNVVKSCIHCHQIGDARRDYYWTKGEGIPEELLYPYPHPKSIGVTMDPDHRSLIDSIEPNSLAAKAGLQSGDEIESFGGQPILSIADMQWVLDRVPASGGDVTVQVRRDGRSVPHSIELGKGWRQAGDISWRVSTWGLRRMALGGLVLDQSEASPDAGGGMGLLVKRVGQYGPHAAAKKAGFREGDVIVAYDGRSDLMRESDVLHHATSNLKPGDRVDVVVMRGGKRKTLKMPIQR